MALAACALLFLLPFLARPAARLLWNARPVSPGEVRERLEALARRAGVPVREILAVQVGTVRLGRRPLGAARLLGLTAGTRCVVLSASWLERQPADVVEAVFAHELGHARRRHLWYLILLAAALLLAAGPAQAMLLERAGSIGQALGAVAIAIGLVFGWGHLSRRFEIEADVEAAALVGPARYREALLAGQPDAAARGGIWGTWGTWLHPPLEARRRSVEGLSPIGTRGRVFAAGGRALRYGVLALFAAAAAFRAAWQAGWIV